MTKITQNQKILLDFAYKNENKISKQQAVELIGYSYYCNAKKHVGDVLSRMVNSGKLNRIRNGHFEINLIKNESVKQILDPDQLNIEL